MTKRVLIKLNPGEPLFVQGEVSGDIYFIVSGRVKVTRTLGDDEWTLGEYGKNEVIGDLVPFHALPHTCTATAVEPTELYSMSSESLKQLLSTGPDVVVAFIKVMAQKIWETNLFLEQGFSIRHREFWIRTLYVLSLLSQLAEPSDGEVRLPDQPLRMDLATALGTKPLQTDQIIKKMTESGLVRIQSQPWGESTLCLSRDQVNAFISYLQHGFDSKQKEERFTDEQLHVATELVALLHEHYGNRGLSVSSFREDALIDLLADRPLLPGHSRDMRRRLLRQNFNNFVDRGFFRAQGKRNRHLTVDLAALELRIREEELIRECDRCYKILIS
ncbi:MAG TPA: Crp/Fnr family transcriptional regulator [bacterium]|nr:Crp/Fnr family transcriptional regulator [bacterium]HQO33300.1 Crp/Fnr family transcriptional regulator [bacterium]HQP98798.1 Crp/Fnr family transcriptional regulator [bacterium]